MFAYGQTGSGKTFTMMGSDAGSDGGGIAPRAFAHVFDAIAAAPPSCEFLLRASFVEIYMEKVRDLLNPRKTDLRVREGASVGGAGAAAGRSGVWIEDAEEVTRTPPPSSCNASSALIKRVCRCACRRPQSAWRCCLTACPPALLLPLT